MAGMSFNCCFRIHDHFLLVNFGLSNCCYLTISPEAIHNGKKRALHKTQEKNEKKFFFVQFARTCARKNRRNVVKVSVALLANFFLFIYRDAIFKSSCISAERNRKEKTLMSNWQ